MRKRPLLFLVVGVMCAVSALLVGKKYLSGPRDIKPTVEFTKALIATKDIAYGDMLVLAKEEDEGNVKFVNWPKGYTPDDIITKDEEIKDKELVATAASFKRELILKHRIVAKDDFMGPGLYPERFGVDREEIAFWKPGMKVDVLKITRDPPTDFIRCAEIFAVGQLPLQGQAGKKGRGVPPNVYILLPQELKRAIIEARLYSKLVLSPAKRDCGDEPVLVVIDTQDRNQLAAEEMRKGEALLRNNRFEEALAVFNLVLVEYSRLPHAKRAAELADRCKANLAEQAYAEAEAAFNDMEFTRCIESCAAIKRKYPTAKATLSKLAKLQQRARQAQEQQKRAAEYQAVVQTLQESYDNGNIPQAERILNNELPKRFAGYEPPAMIKSPDDIAKEYKTKIAKAKREVESIKRLFRYYMGEDKNKEKALQKFNEMKKKFPEHPFVKEAEDKLRKEGFLE